MIGNLALLVSLLVPMGIAFACILAYRWWVKRDKRRSPLTGKLHHAAGEQLRSRIGDSEEEMFGSILMMFFIGPLALLAWALRFVPWSTVHFGIGEGILLVAAVGVFAWAMRSFIRHSKQRRKAQEGLAAERMTAQELNRLVGSGCQVLHDVPGDGFNLDHVVIGPRAVFMVETKSFRKPPKSDDDKHYKVQYDGRGLQFPDFATVEPIEQARRQAQWLSKHLRGAIGQDVPVVPAVALPGWWIDLVKSSQSSDVRVFTPMGRGANFMSDTSPGPLLDTKVRSLIAHALVMRYPDAA